MADHHKLEIDKTGVLEVGAQLRSDVDKDITPRSDRIKQQFMWHAVFGERSGSPVIQNAATQYYGQMRSAIEFLDALIYNMDVFAQATKEVVAAYDHADDLSATDMQTLLKGASAKMHGAQAAAEAARHATEAQERQAGRDEIKGLHDIKRGAS